MTIKFALISVVICTCHIAARADSIFDEKSPSKTDRRITEPKKTAPPPAMPATRPSDPLIDEMNEEIVQLKKENAELKAKLMEMSDVLAAIRGKDAAKEKTQQEHDQHVAEAKARAESERLAKIVSGISLRRAEFLTQSKARLIGSHMVHLEPRVGYWGPLDVRKDNYTLDYTRNGRPESMSLVVTDGTITEIVNRAK